VSEIAIGCLARHTTPLLQVWDGYVATIGEDTVTFDDGHVAPVGEVTVLAPPPPPRDPSSDGLTS
jgi:hypothetical protein